MSIKVVAFDIFGTIFDLSNVPYDEVKAYGQHIRKPKWSELHLPASWEKLPAHPDSAEGIKKLRKQYKVVTLSNGPLELQAKLSEYNGIVWDGFTPLADFKVFKPNAEAYLAACKTWAVEPHEVLMVTANEYFGDLAASRKLGMEAVLIRGEHGKYKDVIELANVLTK